MKDLEKIFFYHCLFAYCLNPYNTINNIVDMYIKIGIPQKQILYYLEKWVRKGFYDYGVNIAFGWFYTNHIQGIEYENIKNIIFDTLGKDIEKVLAREEMYFYRKEI